VAQTEVADFLGSVGISVSAIVLCFNRNGDSQAGRRGFECAGLLVADLAHANVP
jgi:hypothetical protein